MLLGTAACGQARQTHGGGHNIEKFPAGITVRDVFNAGGKLLGNPLLELGGIGQFFQTAPILLAGLLDPLNLNNHRWHPEQFVGGFICFWAISSRPMSAGSRPSGFQSSLVTNSTGRTFGAGFR